jgi:hypothetical protein
MVRPRGFAFFLLPLALAGAAGCTKQAPDAAPRVAADSAATASASLDAAVAPAPESPVLTPDAASPVDAALPEPPIKVKVVTIGMHVGGGPYDEVTKEPIRRSVEPHFAELARCWKHVPQPRQADVGVDLVIEAAGGRAKVSNPRSNIAGEGFLPCVVTFYEGVDFQRPKNGRTTVSYSVRFLP